MNLDNDSRTTFREVQQFRKWWIWIPLLLSCVCVVALFGYGMHKQLILGEQWGERPMSDAALVVVGPLSIFVTLGSAYLMYVVKLVTEVREDGIYIRFYPLRSRKISFSEITKCAVREYSPIREYGGWGIRCGSNGKAYNVSGSRGVQLEFSNGKQLLIGSQEAEELAEAINVHRQDAPVACPHPR